MVRASWRSLYSSPIQVMTFERRATVAVLRDGLGGGRGAAMSPLRIRSAYTHVDGGSRESRQPAGLTHSNTNGKGAWHEEKGDQQTTPG